MCVWEGKRNPNPRPLPSDGKGRGLGFPDGEDGYTRNEQRVNE